MRTEVRSERGWWVIAAILVCAGLLFAVLLPMIRAARDSAREMSSRNNLKQLALAVDNYSHTYKKFPLGADLNGQVGKHGWYTRCMPYLEATSLYNRISFKLHWEHPYQRHIFFYNYACSLRPNEVKSFSTEGYALLHYQGNPNLFRKNQCVAVSELTAGASNTWLIGEVDGQYQPWGYPFNWRALTTPFNTGNGSFGGSRGGFQLAMADDSVRLISDAIDKKTLQALADAPPVVSSDETTVPNRVFQMAMPNRFRTEFVEAPAHQEEKGGAYLLVRFDDEVPTMVDISTFGDKQELPAHNAWRVDLASIARKYPLIKTLIGVRLDDRSVDTIVQFKRLETLWVGRIELSETSFAKLKTLTQLKEFVTFDPNADLKKLRELMPNCEVSGVQW